MMTAIDAANIVRIIALLMGFISFSCSALSLVYFRRRKPPRQLRQHVQRVSLIYLTFVVYGTVEIVTQWGSPFRWQLFAIIVIFVFATHAQTPLLAYERLAPEFENG